MNNKTQVRIIRKEFEDENQREKLYFQNINDNKYYAISKICLDYFDQTTFEYMLCSFNFENNNFIFKECFEGVMLRSSYDDTYKALKELGFEDITKTINKIKDF